MTDARPASLHPPNATPQARRVEQATAWDLDPNTLRTLYDPERIPADLLAWLAWGENVPVWPESERAQRDIIARSRHLHGLIGTAAGLRAGARLAASDVTRLTTPPAKTFLGYWSAQNRRDWLAAMPQLRIYPQRERAPAQGLMLNHDHLGHPAAPALRGDAVFRATSRTTLWRPDGTETELTTREWQHQQASGNATLEVAQRSQSAALHCGQAIGGYPARYNASQRLYRIDQQAYRYGTATLSIRTTTASLTPLSTDVEIVSERAPRPGAQLSGLPLGGLHLCRLDNATRYYRRSYLHDPDVQGRTTKSPAHLGATRLGMPPFNVEARVRVPARRSATLHLNGHVGALHPAGRNADRHMAPTLDAMAWMRAEADKILIDTRHTSPLLARQTLTAGDYTAGQIIER